MGIRVAGLGLRCRRRRRLITADDIDEEICEESTESQTAPYLLPTDVLDNRVDALSETPRRQRAEALG